MRFKKLKISVGIAIVLFILIVGNIYLLGSLNLNSRSNQNNNVNIISPPSYTVKSPSGTYQQSTQQATQPSINQPAAQQQQLTIVQNFNTRAS